MHDSSGHNHADAEGDRHDGEPRTQGRSPWLIALIMVGLVLVFYLVREHWDHLSGRWLYLLLLACPLMHLFGHGGHGGHGGHSKHK